MKNGDLALEGANLSIVSGTAKLVQDLRCAILEARGHDPFHPEFGSIIDGGVDTNGIYSPSMIGEMDWAFVALRVKSEINRICEAQQRVQIDRDRNDRSRYGSSTLDRSEVLKSVTSINISQTQDKMMVSVKILTAANTTAIISLPVAQRAQEVI